MANYQTFIVCKGCGRRALKNHGLREYCEACNPPHKDKDRTKIILAVKKRVVFLNQHNQRLNIKFVICPRCRGEGVVLVREGFED